MTYENLPEFLTVCEQAARTGGEVLQQWVGKFKVRSKAPADLVTEADLASQKAVQEILLEAFPSHGLIGEEAPVARSTQPDYCWIVDPLDGTTNYVHQFPHYCVSVALEYRGELLVGCIFDPNTGECFTARKGHGAFLNGQPIRVSECSRVIDALAAVSFPPQIEADSIYLREFSKVALNAQAVRRMGSAALNLCYVACGRLDLFWARDTKAWDVAAGVLLVVEAGGVLTGIDGKPFNLEDPPFITSATESLHSEFLELIQK